MDGGPSSAGAITHVVKSTLNIDGHQETQTFFVTKLGKYNVILGKPWLKKHSVTRQGWQTRTEGIRYVLSRRQDTRKQVLVPAGNLYVQKVGAKPETV